MGKSKVSNGFIINTTVKMQWTASGFIELVSKGNPEPTFVMASKAYDSVNGGKIAVFFTAHTAFVWADDAGSETEDLWSIKDLVTWVKENLDMSFPVSYDSYIPIIPYGTTECSDAMLEKYGISEFKKDIESRLADLAPYGVERVGAL